MPTMQAPLPFETDATDWRLDERTREIGRRGLAEARAALAEATRRAQRREAERRRAQHDSAAA